MVQVILWSAAALALAGNALVIRRRRSGFACWIVADLVLVVRNAQIGEWAQAVLFAAFLGLAVWGWAAWKRRVDCTATGGGRCRFYPPKRAGEDE